MILDADLPGVPGYEVVGLLRMITRNAPVIMVSARNSLELERKVREQGVHSYHIAPFNQDELRSAVYCAFQEAERIRAFYRAIGGQSPEHAGDSEPRRGDILAEAVESHLHTMRNTG